MKNKIVALVLLVCVIASGGNTFAWGWNGNWFSSRFKGENKNTNSVTFDKIEKEVEKKKETIDNKQKNLVEITKKVKDAKKKQILQKQIKVLEKMNKNEKVKTQVEKVEKIAQVAKIIETIADKPAAVVANKTNKNEKKIVKNIVENRLKNLSTQVVNQLDTQIINKLGNVNSVKEFKLSDKFDPNKVITFDDIKTLYISNFTLYQNLLGCEDPDDAVVNLCNNIANVLDDLTDNNKKLTINDVYKLQVYASTISQAIFYVGTLKEFKKGAVVLGIDKQKNLLKSLEIVRNYTAYDTLNNDVLPVKAKEVDIDILTQIPKAEGNDVKIVLGLNGGAVKGLRLYPVEKNLYIPYAKNYKVMTIKGLTRGCENKKYEYSLWYGYNKIGISRSGENLQPTGTKGIKFNFEEKCYDVFR